MSDAQQEQEPTTSASLDGKVSIQLDAMDLVAVMFKQLPDVEMFPSQQDYKHARIGWSMVTNKDMENLALDIFKIGRPDDAAGSPKALELFGTSLYLTGVWHGIRVVLHTMHHHAMEWKTEQEKADGNSNDV